MFGTIQLQNHLILGLLTVKCGIAGDFYYHFNILNDYCMFPCCCLIACLF